MIPQSLFDGLDQSNVRLLKDRLLLFTPSLESTRTVSGDLLRPPSIAHNAHIWNDAFRSKNSATTFGFFEWRGPAASVRWRHLECPYPDDLRIDIPESLHSTITLEVCGFTAETANVIYEGFRCLVEFNPEASLIDYVHARTENVSIHSQDDPEERDHLYLSAAGLTPELRATILDPEFQRIRQRKGLSHWVHESIETNYRTFEMLQNQLSNVALRLQSRGSVPMQPTFKAESPINCALDRPEILPLQWITFEAAACGAPTLPDHQTLYKAVTPSRMQGWILNNGCSNDGDFQSWLFDDRDSSHIQDHDGSDIFMPASCWTPEYRTAEHERRYIARRCPWSETWVISIQIPNALLTPVEIEKRDDGDERKVLIWFDHKDEGQCFGIPAPADLIITSIDTAGTQRDDPEYESQEDVDMRRSDSAFFDETSRSSSGREHWVFYKYETFAWLMAQARGKMHVEIVVPSRCNPTHQ